MALHEGFGPDLTFRFADHPDGLLDVHLPTGLPTGLPTDPPRGLVVLVHGGFWRSRWDRTHTRPMADALRRRGWAVATPEYRRAGAGGGWPATFDDVSVATAASRRLLADAGVDVPAPTVLLGHSAGGHLVLWLATAPVAAELPVDRVVALAPVGDLRHAWDHGIGDTAISDFLGAPLPEADPARRWPAQGVHPEVVVLHGADDVDVPAANSAWARAAAGVDLRVLPGVDHFAVIDPTSAAWPEVLRAVEGD